MERVTTYPALQPLPLSEGERVGLGDDWNHVHLVVDGLHELDIQRFQAGSIREEKIEQRLVKNLIYSDMSSSGVCVWRHTHGREGK